MTTSHESERPSENARHGEPQGEGRSPEENELDELLDELDVPEPHWSRAELRFLVEQKPHDLARYADILSVDDIYEIMEHEGLYSQKDLAAYLGVAESTVSGWLKEDRMPRMARLACLLLKLKQLATKEMEYSDRCLRKPHIIRDDGVFHIVSLDEKPGEWLYGHFLVKGLENEEIALRYARSFEVDEILEKCADIIEDMMDRTENVVYQERLCNIKRNINDIMLSWQETDEWESESSKDHLGIAKEFLYENRKALVGREEKP